MDPMHGGSFRTVTGRFFPIVPGSTGGGLKSRTRRHSGIAY